MASKRFEKGSPEWLMFQDYWKICQRFWIAEDNEDYWNNLIEEANVFYEKHKYIDDFFVKEIMLVYIEAIDKKFKRGSENKN